MARIDRRLAVGGILLLLLSLPGLANVCDPGFGLCAHSAALV